MRTVSHMCASPRRRRPRHRTIQGATDVSSCSVATGVTRNRRISGIGQVARDRDTRTVGRITRDCGIGRRAVVAG
ncbi:hypothetical protein CYE42_004191, partial [Salmonella enterica subsp. enterica serovar Oslo]|nr:hypothetical protein [Salmonella enterica subsp. enterica serovar Oslo]